MRICSVRVTVALLALTAMTLVTSAADADVITLGASRDTTIFQNNTGNSDGGGFTMFAGNNGMDSPRRGLVDFDVAHNVPAGATITGVQLTLTLQGVAGTDTTPRTIGLHTLTSNWGEGTTGAGMGGGGTGQGFPANPGDATWSQNSFGSSSWAHAGGDFATAPSASAVVSQSLDTAYTWGSTAALVADVQRWLDSPATNFGWLLLGDESGTQTFRQFYTREAANPAFRPTLVISFTPHAVPAPEPGSIALLGIGSLAGVVGRRRLRRAVVR
jgi:hypothetical protein